MKQSILFRVLVVLVFCMASLAIKSETSTCKATCFCPTNAAGKAHSAILENDTENTDYKSGIFFIKI